jgi:hypothetical protein
MAKIHTHEEFRANVEVRGSSERGFGITFGAVSLIVALWPVRSGQPPRVWVLAIAALFCLIAFTRPSLLRPLNLAWMRFGLLLARITNPLILGLLFYLVLTPMALILRLLGKDLLRLRRDPGAPSYWIERNPPGPEPESMANQF